LDGTFGIIGTLTLDAGGDATAVFIFKTASTLISANNSNVVLTGGAQACNVFWQVGSSATLGTGSNFRGSILALTSITLVTGANVDGRVLARNGSVTLDSNTITKPTCLAPRHTDYVFATTTIAATTNAPVVIATSTATSTVATSSFVAIAQITTPIIPSLPNTGFGPENNNISWTYIAFFGIFGSLLAFLIVRRRALF
jgi:hypothetical protein